MTKKALYHAPPLKFPLAYVTLVQNITWSKKAESPSETIDSLITARKVAPERPLVQLKIRARRECLNQVKSISSRHQTSSGDHTFHRRREAIRDQLQAIRTTACSNQDFRQYEHHQGTT